MWWDLPEPAASLYISMAAAIGETGRVDWTTKNIWEEEKFYFLLPIITLNVSVINPGKCDFISSCWGANKKRELIGAQPGRNDKDPGDINVLSWGKRS